MQDAHVNHLRLAENVLKPADPVRLSRVAMQELRVEHLARIMSRRQRRAGDSMGDGAVPSSSCQRLQQPRRRLTEKSFSVYTNSLAMYMCNTSQGMARPCHPRDAAQA
jgi:hypothetical protein